MGSLSVADCMPSKYWANVIGESPLQTAMHAMGALQGVLFTPNLDSLTLLHYCQFYMNYLVVAGCSLCQFLRQHLLRMGLN